MRVYKIIYILIYICGLPCSGLDLIPAREGMDPLKSPFKGKKELTEKSGNSHATAREGNLVQ